MSKHDIIIIAADPWEHYTWRRRHHVAWNLAKNNRVLFIEPPITIRNPFRDIDLSWRHLLNLGRLKHQGRHLYSYSPLRIFPLSLHFSNIFDYKALNEKYVIKQVKKVVDKLRFTNPILWVFYHPYHYNYYEYFNEKLVVTDWYDKFTAPSGVQMREEDVREIRERENRILEKADIVFAVSEELAKDVQSRNSNIFVVPQGVDVDSFTNTTDRAKKSAVKRLRQIKRPLLGFLGIMHNIVDFKLLNHIAEKSPAWTIVLMGREWLRTEDDIKDYRKLRARANVYYVGELKRRDIPAYLKCVDVCLMPMKKLELNRCAAPLKLWEYMASGKPVVAVDQGIKYDCSEFIKTARDWDGFIKRIEECLNEKGDRLLEERRIQIAYDNSWEKRVNLMVEIIEKRLRGT